MDKTYTADELEKLPRKELQVLAKRKGIKANLKSDLIRQQLLLHYLTTAEVVQTPIQSVVPVDHIIQPVAQTKKDTPVKKAVQTACEALTPHHNSPLYAGGKSTPKSGLRVKLPSLEPREVGSLERTLIHQSKGWFAKNCHPISGKTVNMILRQVHPQECCFADYGTVQLISMLLSSLIHGIVIHSMVADGVMDKDGFVLQRETLEKAISTLLKGELLQFAIEEGKRARERFQLFVGNSTRKQNPSDEFFGLTVSHKAIGEYMSSLGVVVDFEDLVYVTIREVTPHTIKGDKW
eukprot:TRINITY_DN254_c0_g2_i16.p1 TRINITY_DN254_c0_g2~~TRINITY_DN254_c0_g2_i16.p1  ORF type:complete len:293 (-),score=50.91 TRINITY_DN254_c0_g2_i16:1927-2805(-)